MQDLTPVRAFCAGVRAAGSRDVVYVPDNPLAHVVRAFEADGETRTLVATREEEAVGIAAGLYLGGRRPTVMMQSSGLGNAVNAVASLLLPYQIPVLLAVSMRGEPGEWNAAQVPMGRAVRPILDALGVQTVEADRVGALEETVRLAAELAFATRRPVACVLSRRALAGGPR